MANSGSFFYWLRPLGPVFAPGGPNFGPCADFGPEFGHLALCEGQMAKFWAKIRCCLGNGHKGSAAGCHLGPA